MDGIDEDDERITDEIPEPQTFLRLYSSSDRGPFSCKAPFLS